MFNVQNGTGQSRTALCRSGRSFVVCFCLQKRSMTVVYGVYNVVIQFDAIGSVQGLKLIVVTSVANYLTIVCFLNGQNKDRVPETSGKLMWTEGSGGTTVTTLLLYFPFVHGARQHEVSKLQQNKFKVRYMQSSVRKVERRQASKNAALVRKLFHVVSQLSQFYGQPARTWQQPIRSHYQLAR